MSVDRRIAFVLLAVAGVYGYLITGLPAQRLPGDVGEALFPWLITAAIVLLSVALLVHPSSSAETSKFVEEEGAEAGHAASASCGIATVAVMAAYIFALPYVGFFIGTTVFAVSLMRLGGSRSVMRDIAVALVTTLVIQMAFTLVLLVPLPSGYWLEW